MFKSIQNLWDRLLGRHSPKTGDTDSPKPEVSPTPEGTDDEVREREDTTPQPSGEAPWLALARKEDGTCEAPGARNNPRVVAYFGDVGSKVVDDETAWCAAFAGAMLERCGIRSTRSLMAKSYVTYGTKCKPKMGAILVFNRGGDPRFGHVGFYVGEDHDSYFILGGNQWNSKTRRSEIVNVGAQPKSRLVACRWPPTVAKSRTVHGLATSAVGETMRQTADTIPADSAKMITDTGTQLTALGQVKWWFAAIGTVLLLVGLAYALYARLDDMKNKGR